jgi:hypothetical protein
MSRTFFSAILIFAMLPSSLQAKTNLSDWNNVERLRIGANIIVSTRTGESFAGELKHVDDDSLILLVRMSDVIRKAVELRRDEIYDVRKLKSRSLPLVLGVGIGAGVGIGIGAVVDAKSISHEDPSLGKFIFGLLGGLGGAAVGGTFSNRRRNGKQIYVAP